MKVCKKNFATLMGMLFLMIAFFMFGNTSANAASDPGYFSYTAVDDGIKITAYSGAENQLIIPETIDKKKVIAIGSNIIKNKAEVTTVVIPSEVKVIEKEAFKNCTGLKSVTIEKNVSTIGDSAFSGCTSLLTFNISNIKGSALHTIGANSFYNCLKLETISLPESLRTLSGSAFFNCYSIKNITIPANVEKIGASAFRGCKNLTNIVIKNGVKTIDTFAFADCVRLNSITIPTSVTFIGNNAFDNIYVDATFHVLSGTYADRYIIERNKTEANPSKITYISKISVSSLSVDYSKINVKLYVGQTESLLPGLRIVPLNSTDMIIWKSFDTSKIVVDNFGEITAKAPAGAVNIKAISNNGSYDTVSTDITIKVLPAPSKITLTEKGKTAATSAKKLEVNKTMTFDAILQPAESKGAPVYYSSSNNAIASFKDPTQGILTAYKEGNVTITAKAYNGQTATYQLQVYKNRSNLKDWTLKSIDLMAGSNYTFMGLTGMSFKSDKTSVATVNSAGVVKAKKAGTAKITILNDSSIATVTVNVKAKPAKSKITSAKVSGKKVTLKWKKQSGISGYKVYYKAKNEKNYKAISTNRKVNQTSYKFTSLKHKTTYYFKIRNYSKIGDTIVYGPYSSVKKVTTK